MPTEGLAFHDVLGDVTLCQGPDAAAFVAVETATGKLVLVNHRFSQANFADEHSLGIQRFYNMLCSVYGSSPQNNAWIIDRFPDMEARAERCPYEYRQKRSAWDVLLAPWLQ